MAWIDEDWGWGSLLVCETENVAVVQQETNELLLQKGADRRNGAFLHSLGEQKQGKLAHLASLSRV